MKKIAYQGVPGSFSHISARHYFGEKNTFVGTQKFKEIFDLVRDGACNYGVLPIENSLAGSIHENYDLLNSYQLSVCGEVYTKIEHQLLACPDTRTKSERLQKIKKVFSHYKALEQCGLFFDAHPWMEKVIYADTAGAAKYVSQSKDHAFAAIASLDAAKLYHLDIIEQNIEDDPENFTRFLIITNTKNIVKIADKCSLILTLAHEPGSLHQVLETIAKENLNLTKIESRPIVGRPFEYIFYVDLEYKNKKTNEIETIIKKLQKNTKTFKNLGFYKSTYEKITNK